MYQLCPHILPSGSPCHSPAIQSARFCFLHERQHRPAAAPSRQSSPAIPFVFPADHAAIRHNLHLTMLALLEGRISPRTADILNSICRTAAANLKAAPLPRRKCIDGEFRISRPARPEHPI